MDFKEPVNFDEYPYSFSYFINRMKRQETKNDIGNYYYKTDKILNYYGLEEHLKKPDELSYFNHFENMWVFLHCKKPENILDTMKNVCLKYFEKELTEIQIEEINETIKTNQGATWYYGWKEGEEEFSHLTLGVNMSTDFSNYIYYIDEDLLKISPHTNKFITNSCWERAKYITYSVVLAEHISEDIVRVIHYNNRIIPKTNKIEKIKVIDEIEGKIGFKLIEDEFQNKKTLHEKILRMSLDHSKNYKGFCLTLDDFVGIKEKYYYCDIWVYNKPVHYTNDQIYDGEDKNPELFEDIYRQIDQEQLQFYKWKSDTDPELPEFQGISNGNEFKLVDTNEEIPIVDRFAKQIIDENKKIT
jgi:hypothetical protein